MALARDAFIIALLSISPGCLVSGDLAAEGAGNGNLSSHATSNGVLSVEEAEHLTFMREEEKLARDVYDTLGERWNIPVFVNIAESEQTHMDALLRLLVAYGIADPVGSDIPGVFTDDDLQQMYDELVEVGMASLEDAFTVGALIEETDIADLQDAIEATDRTDLEMVYESLMCGSRNHLRAFDRQLEWEGATYHPSVVDEGLFASIISGDHERCGRR
jgi:hypothetical protein